MVAQDYYLLVDGIHEATISEDVWEQAQIKVAVQAKKRSILSDKISGDNIYKALVFFDKMYDRMKEAEKREFFCPNIETKVFVSMNAVVGKCIRKRLRLPRYSRRSRMITLKWNRGEQ